MSERRRRTRKSVAASRLALAVAFVSALALLGGASGEAESAISPTPPVTAGLELWYDASSLTTADGQRVSRWPDDSGHARDLTAFDAGAAPTLRQNAVNGRPALEFNGSGSLMKTYGSSFTLSQPTTFFIVYRSLDANTASRTFVFDSRNSNVRQVFGRPSGDQIRMYANSDLDFGGIAHPFSSFQTWSGTFSGSTSSLARDGASIGTGNAGGSSLDGFTLGALSTSGQYGYEYSHFLVAEVLYYSGALSDADRSAVSSWLDQKYNGPPAPPSNTAAPSVSGSASDGSTLTASNGTWTGSQPITYSYEWRRCDPPGGTCSPIPGAAGSTYGLTGADVGTTVKVVVTATNGAGSATVASANTAVVAAAPPANSAPPAISGTARSGSTLTASNGTWTGSSPITFSYSWYRCNSSGGGCVAIAGAGTQSYALTDGEVGSTVAVDVVGTNSIGSATARSSRTAVIGSAPGAGGLPPVTGGLQLWFEAETENYANGDPVTRWSDGSGMGRDLTAFDVASAPIYRRAVVNGRAAIEFDGASQLLKTYGSTFSLAQPTTFFVVYRSLDASTSARAFLFDSMDSGNRQAFGRADASAQRMYANIDLDLPGFTYPFTAFALFAGTFDGTSSSMYQNGTLVGSGDVGGAPQHGLTVGGLNSAAQYGYDLSHSQVAELLYYTGALSASERAGITAWLDHKYALLTAATPPSAATAPAITGTVADGSTLTTSNGTWNGTTPMTYGYRWQRCDTTCTDIAGATAATYTARSADVGRRLTAVVTATNGGGSASSTAPQTATVAATAPSVVAPPAVTGTPQEGATLTTSDGSWDGTTPIDYTYEWQQCSSGGTACSVIAGASARTYALTAADVGSNIRSRVTAGNVAGSASATSALTPAIVSASSTPPSSQPPVITGLQLWYDAGALTAADGTNVGTWPDASGFGRDLTAFDTAASPTMRKTAVNGRPALEFDGTADLMKTYGSTFTLPQPTTFFIVYRALDLASPGYEAYVFDSRNSSARQLFGLGPFTNTEMYADIDVEAPTTYPFPAFQVWSGTLAGDSSSVWRNGSLVAQGPAGGSGLSGFTVGALSTSAQYGYHYGHSLVAEILYYTGAMSDSARAAVSDWLNQRYGAY